MKIEEFVEKCKENSLILTQKQLDNLFTYYQLLYEKNKVMNLTGITELEEVYEKHFFDSLIFSFSLPLDDKTLIDVGTGAGFPGLVLAICYPKLEVTLLEPLTKRCNFLNEVIAAIDISNVKVINERSEDFCKNNREKFDYATARAVAKLNLLLEIIIPLLKVNGTFIALKGAKGEEELEEAKNALSILKCKVIKIEKEHLITDNDTRINLFIEKLEKTSNKYPRNFSQIKKKSL